MQSIAGVVEVSVTPPPKGRERWLLIEVPHGATRTEDYRAVERQLHGVLPDDLIHFFYVNTDIGAPEGAQAVARALTDLAGVVLVRCLIPRTFIDTNRVVAGSTPGVVVDGLTPAFPAYIEHPFDRTLLESLHRQYTEVATAAYRRVCGSGGLALQMHSYAPKSVGISTVDASIVKALHAAYRPEAYAGWPDRPAIDIICATANGSFRSAPELVAQAQAAWAAAGITAATNGTYHLHPATMGMHHARAYPSQVLCVEINRGLMADPFVPFGVSPINESKVAEVCAPLIKTLRNALTP